MPPGIIEKMFDLLLDETSQYFATEEKLIDQYQYPDVENHKSEHVKLLAELRSFKKMGVHDQSSQLVVLQMLKSWLINHIEHADRYLSEFLLDQGVKYA